MLQSNDNIVDPNDAAQSAGLVYVTDDRPGFTRKRRARAGFTGMPKEIAFSIAA